MGINHNAVSIIGWYIAYSDIYHLVRKEQQVTDRELDEMTIMELLDMSTFPKNWTIIATSPFHNASEYDKEYHLTLEFSSGLSVTDLLKLLNNDMTEAKKLAIKLGCDEKEEPTLYTAIDSWQQF